MIGRRGRVNIFKNGTTKSKRNSRIISSREILREFRFMRFTPFTPVEQHGNLASWLTGVERRLPLADLILSVFSFFFILPDRKSPEAPPNKSAGLKETYPSRSFNSRRDDVSVRRGCRRGGLMERRSHSAGIDGRPA